MPHWAVSSPAELCDDPSLGPDAFCMPAEKIEGWLRSGRYTITDAATADTGTTDPFKLRLQIDDGPSINVKFKRAPDELDAFNNSPRFEIAAYETQKLFLDPDEYVVPPTILACVPVAANRSLLPDLAPHPGEDCAIGVIAYWIEGIQDEQVLDQKAWTSNAAYRDSLGKLNALTVLIGHQDSIGDNFYRTKDPERPRLFAVDNGLAFGAMGANPIQWFSSQWSSVRVPILPSRVVARLRHVDHAALETLHVVAELDREDGELVPAQERPVADPTKGVRHTHDVVQMGLTSDEITDMNVRLVKMLGDIDAGRVSASDPGG